MLTVAQASALATAVTSDSTLNTLANANGFQQIADAMNSLSSPAVAVWIPNVATTKLLDAIIAADMPTTAALIGWLQMMLSVVTVNAANANVRAGFTSCFSGKTSLTNLTAAGQQTATRFEALSAFITTAAPANVSSTFGIRVTANDVQLALGK